MPNISQIQEKAQELQDNKAEYINIASGGTGIGIVALTNVWTLKKLAELELRIEKLENASKINEIEG